MVTFQQIFEEREARGEARGRQEGQRDGLLKLLRLKFRGQVTPEVKARVGQGSTEELDRWGERLLVVGRLDAVFVVGEA